MPNPLEKIIDLIKKTGDNCIVLDQNGNPAYVLVDFNNYQKMILGRSELAGLTENELVDKINRDIAIWKSSQPVQNLNNWQIIEKAVEQIKNPVSNPQPINLAEQEKSLSQANFSQDLAEDEDKYYFEPID